MNYKPLLNYAIVVFAFLVLAIVYCKPILNGKVLFQHDMVQSTGAAQELTNFKKETGETSLWTNSMFGGMPSYTIKGSYPNSLTSYFSGYLTYLVPQPANLIFWMLLGGYIMLLALGYNQWISVIGAIGIAFASYNIVIISAGHISKVIAVAYCPPIVAGVVLLYRGKYLLGSLLSLLFVVMELYANHIQISYYLAIGLIFIVLYYLVISIKQKNLITFFKASAIISLIALVSLGSMASKFWTTYEYTKESTRGRSELVSTDTNIKATSGLERDYAYSWSYGIMETFTYIIPNFYGGSSSGKLSEKSNIFKALEENGIPKSNAKDFVQNIGGYGGQLYWGEQSSTSGPAYMGAIFCFLFVLALFVVKDNLKWWILGIVALFTMMACGKNIEWLTYTLFDYFPLYNKFRAVTMIHSLVSIFVIWLAMWGLKEIIERKDTFEYNWKYIKYTSFITLGILAFFLILGTSVFDFEKMASFDDTGKAIQTADDYFKSVLLQVTQQNNAMATQLFEAFKEDRINIFRTDIIRSIIFIGLAIAALWLFIKNKIEAKYLYSALILLVLIDMWGVAKRYLNDQEFQPKRKALSSFEPTAADVEILKDTDPNYRVINTAVSTFNDATTSYFHKSIGGYSGAKLKRIQEVIEQHISKNNMAVLNMLNTKYFIVSPDRNQPPMAQRNPDALGNAWFVNEIKWVANSNEEINALEKLNPKTTAVLNKKYEKSFAGTSHFSTDSASYIKLTTYKPNELIYESNSLAPQFAVFSEIYYNSGLGWNCYLDGNLVTHFRANYILRSLQIPAGKHKIEFKFEPNSYIYGESIALVCSLLILLSCVVLVFFIVKNKKAELAIV